MSFDQHGGPWVLPQSEERGRRATSLRGAPRLGRGFDQSNDEEVKSCQ